MLTGHANFGHQLRDWVQDLLHILMECKNTQEKDRN